MNASAKIVLLALAGVLALGGGVAARHGVESISQDPQTILDAMILNHWPAVKSYRYDTRVEVKSEIGTLEGEKEGFDITLSALGTIDQLVPEQETAQSQINLAYGPVKVFELPASSISLEARYAQGTIYLKLGENIKKLIAGFYPPVQEMDFSRWIKIDAEQAFANLPAEVRDQYEKDKQTQEQQLRQALELIVQHQVFVATNSETTSTGLIKLDVDIVKENLISYIKALPQTFAQDYSEAEKKYAQRYIDDLEQSIREIPEPLPTFTVVVDPETELLHTLAVDIEYTSENNPALNPGDWATITFALNLSEHNQSLPVEIPTNTITLEELLNTSMQPKK